MKRLAFGKGEKIPTLARATAADPVKRGPKPGGVPVLELAPAGTSGALIGFVLEGQRMVALLVSAALTGPHLEVVRNIAAHKEWRLQTTLTSAWKMWAVYSSDAWAREHAEQILPSAVWMRFQI